MSDEKDLPQAVEILLRHLRNREVSTREYFNSAEAMLELISQPWNQEARQEEEVMWRKGYDQCMVDIVDAIADEWGIAVWL